ncbi:MAG: hypothetical protein WC306_03600 [Candidatus Paceibacterota bacterium]|jgi:hypothetical protein
MSTESTFKKRRLPRYLDNIPVYNVERGNVSTFFSTRNLSEYFMLGKNSFFIGGSDKLQQGSEIQIEAIDSLGNVIYTEYPGYKEDDSVLASIYVYDDTASGLCTLILLGIAKDVPSKWKGKINTKWITQIYVDPTRVNKDPIRFIKVPTGSFAVTTKQFFTASIVSQSSDIPVTTPYLRLSLRSAGGYYLGGILTAQEDTFTPSMDGATIEAASQPYPLSTYSSSIYSWNSNITTSISEVVNPKTAYVTIFGYPIVHVPSSTQFYVAGELMSGVIKYQETVYTPTYITASIVAVDCIDIDTYTGKVDKVYVYKKSLSKLEDYSLHSLVTIEETNLLSAEDRMFVQYVDIGKFTNQIIEQKWCSHRQEYSNGMNADRVLTAWPYADPIYDRKLVEDTTITISSSANGIIEQYIAKDIPITGTLQFSGSPSWTVSQSVDSFIYIVNSGSNYLTASKTHYDKGGGLFRPGVDLSIKDSYTGSFDDWYIIAAGMAPGIFDDIVNVELYSASAQITLNTKFPTPSGYNLTTSSGYFSNAVQISESYYSNHIFGEVSDGSVTSSLKLTCYKSFYPLSSMSMYSDTEYIHEAYIAGFGELEIRMKGNAITPDSDHQPLLGRLVGHYSSSKMINYGYQSHTFIPDEDGVGKLYYIIKRGIWDIARSSVKVHVANGYSSNRALFRFPIVPLTVTEVFQFKLVFANPENATNPVEVISQEVTCPGISLTGGGAGGAITVPICQPGAVIISDGNSWRAAAPITGQNAGWLVNEQGLLLVEYLS